MQKLDNTPFAIVLTRVADGEPDPIGMYRGRTHVAGDVVTFSERHGALELVLEPGWLSEVRRVPDAIAKDLDYAEYFLPLDVSEVPEGLLP